MTKLELIKEICKRTGVDNASVTNTIEAMMSVMKDTMSKGECIYLRGFGSFILKHRAQKTARNISKNQESDHHRARSRSAGFQALQGLRRHAEEVNSMSPRPPRTRDKKKSTPQGVLFFYGCFLSAYASGSFTESESSSSCDWSITPGASSMTSRPELFLGKAMQSRMLSKPAKSETKRSRP